MHAVRSPPLQAAYRVLLLPLCSRSTELAWLWANLNLTEYFKGHISKNFGFYSGVRYCIYEHCPENVAHGGVRFTFKEKLLPQEPRDSNPEFKPWVYNSEGK